MEPNAFLPFSLLSSSYLSSLFTNMSMELYSNHQETNPAGGQSDQDSNPSPPDYVSHKLKARPQIILVNGRLYLFTFSPVGIYGATTLGKSTT